MPGTEAAREAVATADGVIQELAEGHVFDVIVLEESLWAEGGLALHCALERAAEQHGTRLLIGAPLGHRHTAARFASAGFAGWIAKPIRWTQAGPVLESVCGNLTGQRKPLSLARIEPVPPGIARGHKRVLVAEDNAVNQRVACALLQREGYDVDIASDGSEAVSMFAEGEYDAVFMDCQMPVMDGFTATSQIRAVDRITGKHTPVIAMTAHASNADRDRCLEAGMDDFLSKPVGVQQLRRALSVLEARQPAEAVISR